MTDFSRSTLSRQTLEQDLALAQEKNDFAEQGRLLLALGDIAKDEEEYSLAQGLYGQAWAAFEQIEDLHGTASTMKALGNLLADLGDFQLHLAMTNAFSFLFSEAQRLYESSNDLRGQGQIWYIKGLLSIRPDEERKTNFETALKFFEQAGDQKEQAKVLLGLAYDMPDERGIYLLQAVNRAHNAQDTQTEVEALIGLARADPLQASTYFKRAAAYWMKISEFDSTFLLESFSELAMQHKDYAIAYSCMKRTLNLEEQKLFRVSSSEREVTIFNNMFLKLGRICRELRKFSEAYFYFYRVLDLWDATEEPWRRMIAFEELAHVAVIDGDVHQMRQYFQQALETTRGFSTASVQKFLIMHAWGQKEYALGYHDEGRDLCFDALALAKKRYELRPDFPKDLIKKIETDLTAMSKDSSDDV